VTSLLERLGERMLDVFVPRITADAATTAGCTYPTCGPCVDHQQLYRSCCNGTCTSCRLISSC
jgi:hypothetical protein